ncbi:MAG: hypothetical protein ACYSW8_32910 [Planctomycetota bacterium]|jgi:hypothetical protein
MAVKEPTNPNPGSVADGLINTSSGTPKTWLEACHPLFSVLAPKWKYSRDHYEGTVMDDAQVKTYLVRKTTGETSEAYGERTKLADYTNHMAAVIDSLAGMLFTVEGEADRKTGKGGFDGPLGDPKDPKSPIGKLWFDVDGRGTNWLTLWKQVTIELLITHRTWLLVDSDEAGNPKVQLIPAGAVTNWRYEDDGIVEALVEIQTDTANSIKTTMSQRERFQTRYLYFNVEGWEIYEVVEKDNDQVGTRQISSGTYAYEDRDGKATLPIFPVELPLRRAVGYALARKANAIFNKESERDNLLRVANFPKLNLFAQGDETFKELEISLKKGAIALWNEIQSPGHAWIAPDTGSATVASDVLERKVDEYYKTAFREYSDAARDRVTATEVRQSVSEGVGAFLQMLKAGVDEAENGVLWRLEQQQFAGTPSKWFKASVQRSKDFVPVDLDATITAMRKNYFGESETIPLGPDGLVDVVRKVSDWEGLAVDEDQAKIGVMLHLVNKASDLFTTFEVPSAAKASLVVRLLAAVGLLDSEETVEMEDGEKVKLMDLVKEQALINAERKEETSARMAEVPPFTRGGPPAPGGGVANTDE